MDKQIKKLKKSLKGDKTFILIVIFLLTGLTVMSLGDVVKYYKKDADKFEIRLVEEGEYKNKYSLFIEDNFYETIDYNDYSNLDYDNNTNIKASFLISESVRSISLSFTSFTFVIFYFMLRDIVKNNKIFTKKNINRMRLSAVLVMLVAIVPIFIKIIMSISVFSEIIINILPIHIFIMIMGVIIGTISEIFKYGYELQEDLNQIA